MRIMAAMMMIGLHFLMLTLAQLVVPSILCNLRWQLASCEQSRQACQSRLQILYRHGTPLWLMSGSSPWSQNGAAGSDKC